VSLTYTPASCSGTVDQFRSGEKSPLSTFTTSVKSAFSKPPSNQSGGFYRQSQVTEDARDNHFLANGGEESPDPTAFRHTRRGALGQMDHEDLPESTAGEAKTGTLSKKTAQGSSSAVSGQK